jgi:hypothetical protein
MPFTAGTFTKLFSWLIDPVRNEKIFNSRLDDEFSGIATALSTAILKDGTQTTTASIPFAQGATFAKGVTVNLNASALPTPFAGTLLQVGQADNTKCTIQMNAFGAAGFTNHLAFFKANGTCASPTPLAADDTIGGMYAFGCDVAGSMTTVPNAFCGFFTSTLWSSTNHSTYWAVYTTPNGSTTFQEQLRVNNAGVMTRPNQPTFSAHKNGTNQTGIANATFTKITFGTERFDVNGNYDAANSKWTPPAGRVLILGATYWSVATGAGNFILSVYKNGVRYEDQIATNFTAGATLANNLAVIDDANGTDFYELYGFGSTGTTLTIDGTASATYFMGYML